MRNISPKNYLAIVLFAIVFMCVGIGFIATRKPDYSLQSTISRANRVVAIEFSVSPRYSWVIATPEDYTIVSADGAYPHHEPAHITYGAAWSGPPSSTSDITSTSLTDEEWQIVDQWRGAWCKGVPPLRPPAAAEAFYTVALRCTSYSDIKTLRVVPNQLPDGIAILLRRAATPTIP